MLPQGPLFGPSMGVQFLIVFSMIANSVFRVTTRTRGPHCGPDAI